MNVTIQIENRGDTNGTLGWLAKHAAKITINDLAGGTGRCAVLRDAKGRKITMLATADEDGINGVYRAGDSDEESYCFETNQCASEIRCWTDAAWAIIAQLIETAKQYLEEPEELASLVKVKIEPCHDDPIVRALAGIANTDLAARNALVDRLQELEV